MTAPARANIGRPREDRIDQAILAATLELLVEVGYSRLSYELIAKRAGVSRPTIYLRWPSKAHVVHDAVFPKAGAGRLIGDTDDFEGDLRRMIARSLTLAARPEARAAVPSLLADVRDPVVLQLVMGSLQDRVRELLAARMAKAVAAGQLTPGTDAGVLLDTITGALMQRVMAQQSVDREFADQLADLLIAGLRPRPAS